MIKVILFNWNALDLLPSGRYSELFHEMAVRECKVIEAGYTLITDSDQQMSYVELPDETEAVEFKLRFF